MDTAIEPITQNQNAKQNSYLYYGGIGAFVGAGLGAVVGILAADPELRKKTFSFYTDTKNKLIEIYHDMEKIQKMRDERRKVHVAGE